MSISLAEVEKRLFPRVIAGIGVGGILKEIAVLLDAPARFIPYGNLATKLCSPDYPKDDMEYLIEYSTTRETGEHYVELIRSSFAEAENRGYTICPKNYGFRERIIAWVAIGERSFGTLVLLTEKLGSETYDPEVIRTVSRCMAMAWISSPEGNSISSNELLYALLSNRSADYSRAEFNFAFMDMRESAHLRLICICARAEADGLMLQRELTEIFPTFWRTWLGKNLVALLGEKSADFPNSQREKLRALAERHGCSMFIGTDFTELTECARQFDYLQAMPTFRDPTPGSVYELEHCAECALFFESTLDKEALEALISPALTRVIAHDAENGTVFFETLSTYIDVGLNTSKAATALFIHYNTVQYRLNRMQELCDFDLSNSDDLFQLMLSLRILRYCKRA